MIEESLEKEKFQFERDKFEREFQLRQQELNLKVEELKKSRSILSPTLVTILVAVVGLLGTSLGALLTGYANRNIERDKFEASQKMEKKKFESDIIMKVATSDSIERNKSNLKFMLNAGFITDEQGKINTLVNDSSFGLKIIDKETGITDGLPDIPFGYVYICTANTSFSYHAAYCKGLKLCNSRIQVVSQEDAEKRYHRKMCGFCYRN